MISVSRSSWMIWNSIKLVEITLPGTGFIASTKNRWDDDGRFVSELFKKRSRAARQSNTANHGFNLDCEFFFLATVPTSCYRFLLWARVGQQIGFYFLNLTRLHLTRPASFRQNGWNVCRNVSLLRRCIIWLISIVCQMRFFFCRVKRILFHRYILS